MLARKWRPAQFSDIVGQGHIVRTLGNAIRSQRIHQAYLFTGSRGIGKTSIARIFAKTIRCENTRLETVGGVEWLRSCDECANCREISSGGEGLDVQEIDGASNNGVEAVREIRTNANFMPARGSRKIYIIDEVHMLTTAAFNALLKTLEEPPAHVIFIFATTEPHKIPATILSRCQRFDFRRVTLAQIQQRLAQICEAEKIQVDPGALALVARAAEGSMRDALSLLDQVIAFAGTHVTVDAVRESVGLVEGQTLIGILQGVFARKPLEALKWIEKAYETGHDLRVLTRSLIEFIHGAILAKIGAPNSGTLELSEEEWNELKAAAELRPLEEIEMIFQVLHHGLDWIARSPQPKVVLDILLVKCATAEVLAFADAPVAAAPATPSAPLSNASTATPSTPGFTAQVRSQQAAPVLAPTPAPSPALREHAMASRIAPQPAAPVQPAPVAAAPAPAAPQAPAAPKDPLSFENFIEHVRGSRPLLASILEHGNCVQCPAADGGDATLQLVFAPDDSYYKDQLSSRAYNEQLLNLSREYFGRAVRVVAETRDGAQPAESVAARREREQKEREAKIRSAAQNHPIIREAKSLFGGELGPIELTESVDHAER